MKQDFPNEKVYGRGAFDESLRNQNRLNDWSFIQKWINYKKTQAFIVIIVILSMLAKEFVVRVLIREISHSSKSKYQFNTIK